MYFHNCIFFKVWFSNRRARMRKQQSSNNPNGSGNYSPIGLSSVPMGYHTNSVGAAVVTPTGACSSPSSYVLPSQSLPEATFATSPSNIFILYWFVVVYCSIWKLNWLSPLYSKLGAGAYQLIRRQSSPTFTHEWNPIGVCFFTNGINVRRIRAKASSEYWTSHTLYKFDLKFLFKPTVFAVCSSKLLWLSIFALDDVLTRLHHSSTDTRNIFLISLSQWLLGGYLFIM